MNLPVEPASLWHAKQISQGDGVNQIETLKQLRMARQVHRYTLTVPLVLVLFSILMLSLWKLSNMPPLWWDEGWTLTVARTWVEQGFYGRMLAGQPDAPGLSASFPSVVSIALSFKLFDVGIWQGRLPFALYTLTALVMLTMLAYHLYNRRVALATLLVMLSMSTHLATNPIYMGRQVLAEPLMLCFLLAGYICLLATLRTSLLFLPLALLMWGIALIAKGQTLSFWAVSLLVPLGVTLFRQNWRVVLLLVVAMGGSWFTARLLLWGQELLLRSRTLPSDPLPGLTQTVALATTASARDLALTLILVAGLPTFGGLGYATWKWFRSPEQFRLADGREVVRLALITLAGSWFAWYALLSIGWPRYFFPSTFMSSMFVAAMLYDLTEQFDLRATLNHMVAAINRRRPDWRSAGAFLALVLVLSTVPITLRELHRAYNVYGDDESALQVAHFLNTQTAYDALVETYDSEIFFLINRRYHYPPDQFNVDMIRRRDLGKDIPLSYDPLKADPDYLVIGAFSRSSQLYDAVLATDEFRLLQSYGQYDIYERIR